MAGHGPTASPSVSIQDEAHARQFRVAGATNEGSPSGLPGTKVGPGASQWSFLGSSRKAVPARRGGPGFDLPPAQKSVEQREPGNQKKNHCFHAHPRKMNDADRGLSCRPAADEHRPRADDRSATTHHPKWKALVLLLRAQVSNVLEPGGILLPCGVKVSF